MNSNLREALNQLLGLIDNEILVFNESLDASDISQAQYHIDKAVEAYEKPLRNCDVGTAEEQGERLLAQFEQWKRKFQGKKIIVALMEWAQMPYESEVQ